MNRTKDKSDYIIQAVIHALDLLEAFDEEAGEWGVTELSRSLKLTKNNTFRLLATLESREYIERNPATDRYRLGLKALELRQTYLRHGGLMNRSRPLLESLQATTGETVYLALLKKSHIVYVAALESQHPVRVASRLGTRLPAYCTASGKAHLALLDDEELDLLYPVEELTGFTPQTHRSRTSLKEELSQVARQGYAVDNEEYDPEVRCVAAAVRDYTSRAVGALSISAPAFRISEERLQNELAPLIIKACAEISKHLGFRSER